MLQTLNDTGRKLFSITSKDEIYTIDELIKRRASELEDLPLLGYPKESLTDFEEHSARAVDRYVDAAVETLQQRGLKEVDGALTKLPVVGILAHSNFHYIMTVLALSRLGYVVLLLSTRLANPALVRLLDLAECEILLTTTSFHPRLEEIRKEKAIHLFAVLDRADYFKLDAPAFRRTHDPLQENAKNAVIIHSSGSTGLPKPIYLTHRSCIASFATSMDMKALHTSPLFHSFAFYETFRSIYSGKPMYYFNYALPLTKQNLIATLNHIKPDLFHCVPYVLKLLAESEDGIRALANINLVLFGGSACPDDLGDRLVDGGVNLVANYGATETGRLSTSARPSGDKDWNYLRILPQCEQYVLMDEISPAVFECVALNGLKSKSTINSDDPPGSFRTRDLFVQHRTRPGLWKYLSRLDDRFTLTMGEKVLPLPIEGRIRQESLVKEAAVFGEGRTVPGILIFQDYRSSHLSKQQFLNKIWPAIKDANSRAESYSHIPKELVVVLPAETEYPQTDKGTFIRAQMYMQFQREISAAYAEFEDNKGGSIVLGTQELEVWLLRQFHEHLDVGLESYETDFFASGIDSLQCIKMWTLMKKELDLGERQTEISQNVLYETGNIKTLAKYLNTLKTGQLDKVTDEQQVMKDLIDKYSIFETGSPKARGRPRKEVVLLSGVTGGLGAHLLAQLVSNIDVSAVWALVRAPSDVQAHSRVLQNLKSRDIRLSHDEQRKVVALSSDLSKSDFGIHPLKLEELRSCLTVAIHSAWAVNFNIAVQSFEEQHIKATHNLIKFCQSVPSAEPARFYFCSSVSTASSTPRPGRIPERPVGNIKHVQSTGYARSKFVTEHIVCNAARDARAEARVLRVGQLVGDSKVGQWNTTEGVPLMIQTAITLGALPSLDEEMSWLPVDHAASIILDIARINGSSLPSAVTAECHNDPNLVYHVLNPRRFHWTRDMLPALSAAGLDFQVLPTNLWMDKLRNSDRDPKTNPPIKLIDWFERKYGHGANTHSKGTLEYLTEQTAKASESFGRIPDVTDTAFVRMMVERLRKHWDSSV